MAINRFNYFFGFHTKYGNPNVLQNYCEYMCNIQDKGRFFNVFVISVPI